MQLALVSEDASYRQLKDLGEALRDDIETVPGVRRSEVWAYPKPEVRVAVDLERMGRAGVTLGQIEAAIRGENATIPGGAVDVGLRKFNLKTSGGYDSLDEIAETVVASRSGRIVKVRDVAEVAGAPRRSCTRAASMASAPSSSRRTPRTAWTSSRCATASTSGSLHSSTPAVRRQARARLRPDAQRRATGSTGSASTSRSPSAWCC